MDGKGVNGDRQVLGVDLSKLLATRIIPGNNIDILTPAHAVIFAVAHNEFIMGGWQMVCNLLIDGEGIVYDIKGSLNRDLIPDGVFLMRL